MTLRTNMRAFRAATAMLVCVTLTVSPAGAGAASSSDSGLGNRLGLGPTMQLAAMNTALAAGSSYFGRQTGCTAVTSVLASQAGYVMAGNFRDSSGNCYVWLNLQQSSAMTGSEICKVALHEFGHLTGLVHTQDAADVMFSPFNATPIPGVCAASAPVASAKTPGSSKKAPAKAKAQSKNSVKGKRPVKASALVARVAALRCPPGAKNADYCELAPVKAATKKATRKRTSR